MTLGEKRYCSLAEPAQRFSGRRCCVVTSLNATSEVGEQSAVIAAAGSRRARAAAQALAGEVLV